jgi:hypothetical protein
MHGHLIEAEVKTSKLFKQLPGQDPYYPAGEGKTIHQGSPVRRWHHSSGDLC